MKLKLFVAAVLALGVCVYFFIKIPKPIVNVQQQEFSLLPQIAPAVVSVIGGVNHGSGFVIDSRGYILTNYHVVADNYKYSVVFADGRVQSAKVVAQDNKTDLALLKIEGSNFPAVKIAAAQPQIAEKVFSLGNANGKQVTNLADGQVIALDQTIQTAGDGSEQQYNLIKTSINLASGNSGSPLFNLKGLVVGLNVAAATASSYAIPANKLNEFLAKAIK